MPSASARALAEGLFEGKRHMTNASISRRSVLGGLAAAVIAPAAPTVAASVEHRLDAVPAWRGPGLYEVAYASGRSIFLIEEAPARPGRGVWVTASESLADRAAGGTWSMPAESLAFQRIRKVGDID